MMSRPVAGPVRVAVLATVEIHATIAAVVIGAAVRDGLTARCAARLLAGASDRRRIARAFNPQPLPRSGSSSYRMSGA